MITGNLKDATQTTILTGLERYAALAHLTQMDPIHLLTGEDATAWNHGNAIISYHKTDRKEKIDQLQSSQLVLPTAAEVICKAIEDGGVAYQNMSKHFMVSACLQMEKLAGFVATTGLTEGHFNVEVKGEGAGISYLMVTGKRRMSAGKQVGYIVTFTNFMHPIHNAERKVPEAMRTVDVAVLKRLLTSTTTLRQHIASFAKLNAFLASKPGMSTGAAIELNSDMAVIELLNSYEIIESVMQGKRNKSLQLISNCFKSFDDGTRQKINDTYLHFL